MSDAPQAANDTRRAHKSEQAFRTISEVADELDLPQHVLRFWESKFNQVSPMKRGGGRRYYRPEDVELLRRIKSLLHFDGYTIKGVQKLLSEGGSRNLPPVATSASAAPAAAPASAPEIISTASDAAPRGEIDVAALSVLVGELEEIRDHLKKSVS